MRRVDKEMGGLGLVCVDSSDQSHPSLTCYSLTHTGGKIVVGKTALAIIIIETSINILMEVLFQQR